jgi:cysteinyl-tRNA synthetase
MSGKYLGFPFDIHGGGMDLRFPHHENEIAQAEAATGKQFAKYWMHIGLLTVNGEKMSKSLGNIVNITDLLKKWDAEIIRMFFAQAHYRSPPDFSEKALETVRKGLDRINRVKEKLQEHAQLSTLKTINKDELTDIECSYLKSVDLFQKNFEQSMDDDFNTPQAFAELFTFINTSNRFFHQTAHPDATVASYALTTLLRLGHLLTLFQKETDVSEEEDSLEQLQKTGKKYGIKADLHHHEEILKALLDVREEARKNKKWQRADAIRDDLEQLGYEIQDTQQGAIWRKK